MALPSGILSEHLTPKYFNNVNYLPIIITTLFDFISMVTSPVATVPLILI